ncbi:MAG TPA: ECF-type sigma factor [Bryobacteraceae bacterium]
MPLPDGEITRLLAALKNGDRAAETNLVNLVYPDLHAIARHYMRQERPDHTLQPTALVNEAYLRLMREHEGDLVRTFLPHVMAGDGVEIRINQVDQSPKRLSD